MLISHVLLHFAYFLSQICKYNMYFMDATKILTSKYCFTTLQGDNLQDEKDQLSQVFDVAQLTNLAHTWQMTHIFLDFDMQSCHYETPEQNSEHMVGCGCQIPAQGLNSGLPVFTSQDYPRLQVIWMVPKVTPGQHFYGYPRKASQHSNSTLHSAITRYWFATFWARLIFIIFYISAYSVTFSFQRVICAEQSHIKSLSSHKIGSRLWPSVRRSQT